MAHALVGREERIDDGGDDGDRGRDVGAGEEAGLAPVQLDAVLEVERGKAVEILVVADALFERGLLRVGDGVGETRAEIAGEAGGVADLGGQARKRRARKHDRGLVDGVDELGRFDRAVVDHGKAVEHRAAGLAAFLDAGLRLVPLLVARVAVGRRRHDVGEADLVELGHQLDLQFQRAEAAARLRQAFAADFGLAEDVGELLVFRQRLVAGNGCVDVDQRAGRPAREVLPAHGGERVGVDLALREVRAGAARFECDAHAASLS